MSKVERRLESLKDHLRSLGEDGALEHGQLEALERGIALLDNGLRTNDLRAVRAAISRLAAEFVHSTDRNR